MEEMPDAELMSALSESYSDSEVYLASGEINYNFYHEISEEMERKKDKQQKLLLVLATLGGDPNAGYRIAKCLLHYFGNNITIFIPFHCKSAGTLICIVASKLIIGNRGELGPLDVQISNSNEIFENMSGLDIVQTVNVLRQELMDSFRLNLLDLRRRGLATTLSADISTKLARGLIEPISSNIDPILLGQHQRAIQIATDYGLRLNKKSNNLQDDAIERLVGGYPCHDFVIDRSEAKELFKEVRKPNGLERFLEALSMEMFLELGPKKQLFLDIKKTFWEEKPGRDQDETPKGNNDAKLRVAAGSSKKDVQVPISTDNIGK